MAGVLDAVPLETLPEGAAVIFDARKIWYGFEPLEATTWVYERYVNATTTMAKMNPGFDMKGFKHSFHPPLTGVPEVKLTDYIVKERLFNLYLPLGCVPLTKEHALMERIVNANPWPKPIAVWGYDATFTVFPQSGDLFEAETDCVRHAGHSMGQVASQGSNNLAYMSRGPPISEAIRQPPRPPRASYNSSATYLTVIIGDGDNIDFLKGSRKIWMNERVARCKMQPRTCFPLEWTVSPHTFYAAPDMFRWFLNQSSSTGSDWLTLPPSGHLYAYPAMLADADQEAFVGQTERDCELLNTSGTVSWEWFTTWGEAIKEYYPRYSKRGVARGFFAVNVPFLFPIPEFGFSEQFKILGDRRNVVLFRPNEWRGARGKGVVERGNSFMTAKEMADKINSEPKGSVKAIYTTSDGGLSMSMILDMFTMLDSHVQVVDADTLTHMALQRTVAPEFNNIIV